MKTTRLVVYTALFALATQLPVPAQGIITYSNRATFLAATSATDATGALPSAGNVGLGPKTVGTVIFTALASPQALDFAEWSTRLPGNELALSGVESMDVASTSPIGSFGFDFVEPQFDPNVNATFIDSTFTVSLFNGANGVGAFTFNAPNDTAAFVGVWANAQFTRVEIRETVGGLENEFYGHFYTGPAPVPEPSVTALFLVGILVLGVNFFRRRKPVRAA